MDSDSASEVKSPSPAKYRKAVAKRLPPTNCLVCGSPANCCHYDVPCCICCKAFFRRCITKSGAAAFSKYRCKFGGNCRIYVGEPLVQKGDKCRACRFQRCVRIGMDPLAIQLPTSNNDDYASDERRKALAIAHSRRRAELASGGLTVLHDAVRAVPKEQAVQDASLETLLYAEEKLRQLRDYAYGQPLPRKFFELSLTDLINTGGSTLGKLASYEKPLHHPLPWSILEAELKQFGFFQPPEHVGETLMPRRPHNQMLDMYLTAELAMSAIPAFKQAEVADAEQLLLHTLLPAMLLMQFYYTWKRRSETLIMPDGMMPILYGAFVEGRQQPAVAEMLMQLRKRALCHPLIPLQRVALSDEEFVLLRALVLCHSLPLDHLSDASQRLFESERATHSSILLNRLQSRLGEISGARRYVEILALVEHAFSTARAMKEYRVYLQLVVGIVSFVRDPPYFLQSMNH